MTEQLSLSHTRLQPQGFILLPKTECDVREVEFARCLRLRQTSLEPVAFRLPRVRVSWEQSMPTPSPPPRAPVRGFGAWLVLSPDCPTYCSVGHLHPLHC